jgi:hypothetical protein
MNRFCRKVLLRRLRLPFTQKRPWKWRTMAQVVSLHRYSLGLLRVVDEVALRQVFSFIFGRSRVPICIRRPAILIQVFSWFFSVSAATWRDSDLQLRHNVHLPGPSQFFICLSSTIRRCIIIAVEVLKKYCPIDRCRRFREIVASVFISFL